MCIYLSEIKSVDGDRVHVTRDRTVIAKCALFIYELRFKLNEQTTHRLKRARRAWPLSVRTSRRQRTLL